MVLNHNNVASKALEYDTFLQGSHSFTCHHACPAAEHHRTFAGTERDGQAELTSVTAYKTIVFTADILIPYTKRRSF